GTIQAEMRMEASQQAGTQPGSQRPGAHPAISTEQLRQELLHSRPDRAGQKIPNPNAAVAQNTMVSLLRQQHQDAIHERINLLASQKATILFNATPATQTINSSVGKTSGASSRAASVNAGTLSQGSTSSSAATPKYEQISPAACQLQDIYTVNGRNTGV